MNHENIVSLPVSADLSSYEYELVKLTSTGVAIATDITDRVIGTLLRGNDYPANGQSAVGQACSVKLTTGSIHYVKCGNATAIAVGDELEQDTTDGRVVKRVAGECIGISANAVPASSDGGIFQAILFPNAFASPAPVETVIATNVITAAESGKTFFLGHATEFVSTLPAPAAGLKFTFIVSLAPSGDSYTIVTNGTTQNVIHGVAVSSADAGGSVSSTAGTPVDVITFVDGQAKVGDRIELICDGTYWYAAGLCSDEDAITFS